MSDEPAMTGLYVTSLDAGLVAPGSNTNIWNYTAYDKVPVDPSDGFAFDLYSNLYATNYVSFVVLLLMYAYL